MEIERKFLLNRIPEYAYKSEKLTIEQAYISTKPVIRIRRANDKYILTIKGKGLIAREEFELFISKDEYEHLKEKVENNIIKKTRYILKESEYIYEIDEFHEKLKGLLLVEIEFSSIENANKFIPPPWFGKEVSNVNTYHNSNLCKLESPPK